MASKYKYYWNKLRDNFIWATSREDLERRNDVVLCSSASDDEVSFLEHTDLVEFACKFERDYKGSVA